MFRLKHALSSNGLAARIAEMFAEGQEAPARSPEELTNCPPRRRRRLSGATAPRALRNTWY